MDSTWPRAASPAAGAAGDVLLSGLSDLLWRERELLETLLFRLTVQYRLLDAGDLRWTRPADDDVRAALHDVRECEVLRGMESDSVLAAHALPAEGTLADLAEVAAEPWSTILHDHRQMLAGLTADVDDAAAKVRALVELPDAEASRDER